MDADHEKIVAFLGFGSDCFVPREEGSSI
jgi:hypothetical protein